MPCPFASLLGASAAVGGAHTLFVKDSTYRSLAWSLLLAIAAGWTGYFALWREPPLRIALEVLSVAAILAGALRVRWLIRVHRLTPPLYGPAARLAARVWTVAGAPWVLATKVWLASMLFMEWRGLVHFGTLEYAVVTGLLLAFAALRIVSLARSRREFATLESLAGTGGNPAANCPLGFGCERVVAEPGPRGATVHPLRAAHERAAGGRGPLEPMEIA